MRRRIEHPENGVGDVLRLDRLGTGVGRVVTLLITGETHQRELAFAQARLDIADPHARTLQVAAQVQGELFDERLARAIHMAARVRVVAGDGAEVDDAGATTVSDQAGQQQTSAVHQAFDVGVDHGVPIVEVALGRRVNAQGQAGVVDQPAQFGEGRRQVGNRLLHGLAITHVEHQAMDLGLLRQLGAQRIEALFTTAGQHQFPAGFGKTTGAGFTKTGGRAGNKQGVGHRVLLASADRQPLE